MMKESRKSKKQIKKLMEKECYLCNNKELEALNVHRIEYGCYGGTYKDDKNLLVVCSNCHSLIHASSKRIIVDGWYYHTSLNGGKYILHYWKDGVEFWK